MARQVKPRNSLRKRKRPTKNTEAKSLNRQYLFEYGVNFDQRIVTVSEEIGEGSFDLIDSALQEMEAQNHKPIIIRIKSPGGSVYEAIAMVGRIKASPCKIITEGYGMVMSAATMLLSAGDVRRVSRYTWFMHHESAYSVGGRHSEVKAYVAQAEREEQVWAVWMAELTGKPAKFWATKGIHIDAYFTADQLVELGVADEVF